ncbi:unnamed protein product [Musa acuminata subsp. burmannicoides]
MKRPIADLDSLMPICPSAQESGTYGGEFQPLMDGLEDEDDCGAAAAAAAPGEKKRRLSVEQVRALERSFEVENKLEPERKLRLAQDLGLQPRQVAVWFQNRRARWKTKQLERDYTTLKASYEALRLDYDSLHRDKESLLAQIEELKAKLTGEESLSVSSVKEEPVVSEAETKAAASEEEPPALIYKDGSSDSDSSAVLNDAVLKDYDSRRRGMSSSQDAAPPATAELGSSTSSVPTSAPPHLAPDHHSRPTKGEGFLYHQHHPMLKMEEEEEFLGREEPFTSFFSDEQPPTLNWYYPDHWN